MMLRASSGSSGVTKTTSALPGRQPEGHRDVGQGGHQRLALRGPRGDGRPLTENQRPSKSM